MAGQELANLRRVVRGDAFMADPAEQALVIEQHLALVVNDQDPNR
jgi:hypothetical protein